MTETCLLYVTAPDQTEALRLARHLVEEHLVACANVLGNCRSVFHWEGDLQETSETILLLKTTAQAETLARKRLVELHPYDMPCVVALPIQSGHNPFLDWVQSEVERT